MQLPIDLRSDTVTRPTPGMRAAMAAAEVGDDVFGEDPTVRRLEERIAAMLGKEAALFVPSGTMGNQLGVRVHCQAGDEFLCEANCHILCYEQGAYAQLFGIAAQPVEGDHGVLQVEQLMGRIRPGSNDHCVAHAAGLPGEHAQPRRRPHPAVRHRRRDLRLGRRQRPRAPSRRRSAVQRRRRHRHLRRRLGQPLRHRERLLLQRARRAGRLRTCAARPI